VPDPAGCLAGLPDPTRFTATGQVLFWGAIAVHFACGFLALDTVCARGAASGRGARAEPAGPSARASAFVAGDETPRASPRSRTGLFSTAPARCQPGVHDPSAPEDDP
jgi:hypothetical protein